MERQKQDGQELDDLNFTIVGLGLMGGAFAKAFRKLPGSHVYAFDKNEEVLEQALTDGVIDAGFSDEKIRKALVVSDVVVVCLYPDQTVGFIRTYMNDLKPGALLTDIAGVKQFVLDQIASEIRDDINYISGHPMAGSEKEGYGGADDRIFNDRNYILIPGETYTPEAMEKMKDLVRTIGFTNIVETTPDVHDSKIAYTSQLCHVIASALIYGEEDLQITDYEGGSFADLTRIAMINAPMWTELFIENRDALVDKIDSFMDSMGKLRNEIANREAGDLENTLSQVRQKRIKMEIDRMNKHRKKD